MKKLLQATFLAAVLGSSGAVWANNKAGGTAMNEPVYDPFVPVGNFHNCGLENPAELLEIHRKYGINRFALPGPGVTVRLVGFPELKWYEQKAQQILDVKKIFAGTPVKLSWWCAPFLKMGLNAPFQHIVGVDGRVSPIGICPLDEQFRKAMAERFALIAGKARPEMILIEDDYSLQNHTDAKFGCFCPLHLESFAVKAGRRYSREELEKIFREDRRETLELRKLFAENARDSLVLMAKTLREAVDKVAPEVRIGLCETRNTDSEAFISVAVPQALAGKNTRPLIRVRSAWYTSIDSPQNMPDYLAHAMYTGERLPDHFEYVHEGDTYPHTTYFHSAALLQTFIEISLAFGADNSLLYAGQYLDDIAEDPAFFEMFRRNAKRFEQLRQACRGGKLDGVRIIYDHFSVSTKRSARQGSSGLVHTAAMLARMGIPHSTKYGTPAILAGQSADTISDAEIREILSKGVLLDAEAAEILDRRGFSELTGTKVLPVTKYGFVGEKMCDLPIWEGIKGRYIYNLAFAPAGSETAVQYKKLQPLPGAEVLSYFFDPFEKPMQPGMIRFTNKLGGRVCVLTFTISFNRTANLFSLRKQEMLRRIFNWLGGRELPAAVKSTPNVWLLMRETAQGTLLFITNISTGAREDLEVALAQKFRNRKICELDGKGIWQPAAVEYNAAGNAVFKGTFLPVQMRVFRIAK